MRDFAFGNVHGDFFKAAKFTVIKVEVAHLDCVFQFFEGFRHFFSPVYIQSLNI